MTLNPKPLTLDPGPWTLDPEHPNILGLSQFTALRSLSRSRTSTPEHFDSLVERSGFGFGVVGLRVYGLGVEGSQGVGFGVEGLGV